jgi:hypothetical protein
MARRSVRDLTRIELLYIDGCPNHERLHDRVRELVRDGALPVIIEPVLIASDDEARELRFLGSPSLRVDGLDVEPGAGERTDFGLKCRLFLTPAGLRGLPAEAWVLAALATSGGGRSS